MTDLYVNYGCGFSAPQDWLNFDASPTLRFERLPVIGVLYTKNERRFPANVRYGDIVRGLPVGDASCRGLYSSHMLDYLSEQDARRALANSRRLLAPAGVFRIVIEDCRRLMRDYLAQQDDSAAAAFMQVSGWGRPRRDWRDLLRDHFGHPYRLWLWDEFSLAEALRQAGFSMVRRAQFGDCADPHFATVEDPGRWQGAIAFECRG